jgi:hypothetical protein
MYAITVFTECGALQPTLSTKSTLIRRSGYTYIMKNLSHIALSRASPFFADDVSMAFIDEGQSPVSNSIFSALRARMRVMSSGRFETAGAAVCAVLPMAEYYRKPSRVIQLTGKAACKQRQTTYRERGLESLVCDKRNAELRRASHNTSNTTLEESSCAFLS